MSAPPEAGLATIADLAGMDPAAPKVKPKPGETLAQAALRLASTTSVVTARSINLFARSALQWLVVGDAYTLACGDTKILVIPAAEPDRYHVFVDPKGGQPHTIAQAVDLAMAQGLGEEHARTNGLQLAKSTGRWRNLDPSPGQLDLIKRMHIAVKPETRGEAADAITIEMAARTIARIRRTRTAA